MKINVKLHWHVENYWKFKQLITIFYTRETRYLYSSAILVYFSATIFAEKVHVLWKQNRVDERVVTVTGQVYHIIRIIMVIICVECGRATVCISTRLSQQCHHVGEGREVPACVPYIRTTDGGNFRLIPMQFRWKERGGSDWSAKDETSRVCGPTGRDKFCWRGWHSAA